MSTKILKGFQELAIQSGVDLFTHAKGQLDAIQNDATSRAHAVNHNGYLLIEAPTGSGKTLIAGNIVERFSHVETVVWFWFAPFKGVVGQTVGSLREQFHGLRLREMHEDRVVAGSRRGDVFVTTWQTVAARVKDSRSVRKNGELNPSVDELVKGLRAAGLRIGVVVDEAHHGFHGDTQAATFFREVLAPDYTILVTATPDDADVRDFEKRIGIAELHRVRIGRIDAVDSGLIKAGIKCAAYFVAPDKKGLVDLESTALREGAALHRRIKKALAEEGISLNPLMLVQVDSTDKSVQRAKDRLSTLGFTDEQIAVHTAEEPDNGLLALANDERREVLIFKMAVALGFDAPRAFTLVSMRASRDADFGVQLVGRILRVHRRLQQRAQEKRLPELLRYGYVFLADAEAQAGIDIAGQRINQIQTEYARVSPSTALINVGGQVMVQVLDSNGQPSFFQAPVPIIPTEGVTKELDDSNNFSLEWMTGGATAMLFPPDETTVNAGIAPRATTGVRSGIQRYHYPLKPGVPRRFKTQVVAPDPATTEEDCAQRFMLSARELLDAIKGRVRVERRVMEVFTQQLELDYVGAALDANQAAELAQKALMRSQIFDPRELRRSLLRKLRGILREETMEEADNDELVERLLNVILATNPQLLHEAQKNALAAFVELEDAEELPSELVSEYALVTSTRNVYGVVPSDLNSWERSFAEYLDRDVNNVIQWWHRNLPHKPWSVNVLLPDGSGFFPDFVLGIEGRKTESGILLAETKFAFELSKEVPKTLAEHRAYGRVLVIHRNGGVQWTIVRYDQATKKPVLSSEFRLVDAAAF